MPSFEERVFEYIKNISRSRIREADKRDKTFILVTTGTLALSITFLANIQSFGFVELGRLFWGWGLLIISLLSALIGYLTVDKHFAVCAEEARNWKDRGAPIDDIPKDKNVWTLPTNILNYISYFFAIAGIILLASFAYPNIKIAPKNQKENIIERRVEMLEQNLGILLKDQLLNRCLLESGNLSRECQLLDKKGCIIGQQKRTEVCFKKFTEDTK